MLHSGEILEWIEIDCLIGQMCDFWRNFVLMVQLCCTISGKILVKIGRNCLTGQMCDCWRNFVLMMVLLCCTTGLSIEIGVLPSIVLLN